MTFTTTAIRILGIIVTTGFIAITGNLHGCAQSYGDRTQSAWLVKHKPSRAIHKTDPLTDAASTELYVNQVSTIVSGRLESPVIGELSGMAVSRTKPHVYWAINDSGNLPELFAIGADGKHFGSFKLPVENRDWEDIASYQHEGQSWLVIADSGDNIRKNKISKLHFFREPSLPQQTADVTQLRTVSFSYEDGPQNVESIAVSVKERLVFLVSKNAGMPKIYAIPIDAESKDGLPVLAKLVGRINQLGWTDDDRWLEKILASRILLSATSMDISADDSLAVIGNYRHAYLFRREPEQSWIQALQATPQIVSTHRLAQSESIAFSDDAKKILIGSEGRYAPLLTVNSEN